MRFEPHESTLITSGTQQVFHITFDLSSASLGTRYTIKNLEGILNLSFHMYVHRNISICFDGCLMARDNLTPYYYVFNSSRYVDTFNTLHKDQIPHNIVFQNTFVLCVLHSYDNRSRQCPLIQLTCILMVLISLRERFYLKSGLLFTFDTQIWY